jgi:polyprenyl P-hydroxybenzoate/phenylacrylic acid decarboxylase-like protein
MRWRDSATLEALCDGDRLAHSPFMSLKFAALAAIVAVAQADVVIKERGQLILLPREMPFSAIHLENMLKLARLGVTIMPASPGFYHQPQTIDDLIDFVVARILDHLGLKQTIQPQWGYGQESS